MGIDVHFVIISVRMSEDGELSMMFPQCVSRFPSGYGSEILSMMLLLVQKRCNKYLFCTSRCTDAVFGEGRAQNGRPIAALQEAPRESKYLLKGYS